MGELSSGSLVLVATPIGNLGDLSDRARDVLRAADVVCCEDTRRTRELLAAAGIPAGRRLVSVHAHNEAGRAAWVVERVARGATVAVVSDAGTPAVSDPGERLVRAVAEAGFDVSVVPGPSAALAALAVCGLATSRFCVEGFLPRRGAERERRVAALRAEPRTTVVFEAPTRVAATLAELAAALGEERRAAVCRELTKRHEEVWRASLGELAERAAREEVRGEVVVVLAGAPEPAPPDDDEVAAAVDAALGAGATTRDAAATVAAALGVSRRRAYEAALRGSTGGDERRR